MPIAVLQSDMSDAYVGTSGWNYKHWGNGEFYPKDLRPAEWLMFFSKQFSTVEINNSFYRLPSEAAYKNWAYSGATRIRFFSQGQPLPDAYQAADLDRDVNLTREWLKSGLDVYMYFNNDGGGHAIRNAAYVQQALLNVGIDKQTRAGRSTKPRHSWRPL